MKSLLVSLFLMSLFIACGEKEKTQQNIIGSNNIYQENIENALEENDRLRKLFSERVIMNQVSIRQRNKFASAIENTRIYLALLLRNPKDEQSLQKLNLNRVLLEDMALQRRDFEFVNNFLKTLKFLVLDIAQYQGKVIKDLAWPIYNDSFDTGLKLYRTFNGKSSWQLGEHNRKSYVSIRSKDTSSWLVTPKINLEKVYNPKLQVKQLFNLKRNLDRPLNKDLIRNAIKVMVSTDYEYGNPKEASWQRLSLGAFPFVSDFNAHLSKKIDLNQYAEKTISIAFVLDLDYELHGGHSLLWQINEITLLGASEKSQFIEARKDPTNYVYKHDFSQGLSSFEQFQKGEAPAEFKEKSRNGQSYVEISGFDEKNDGVVYLVSRPIELEGKDYSIKVNQGINFYSGEAQDKEYIQILIGAYNEDFNSIEWKKLDFKNTPSGDNWTAVESEWLALKLKNEKVQIAFRYESGNGLSAYPNWSLFNVQIKEDN